MLKRKFRLTENYDFQRVKKRGQRIYGPFFSLSWLNNNLGYSRFGFIATTKIGKAVKRHRAVRLLRETVRLMSKEVNCHSGEQGDLRVSKIKPSFDVVFVAHSKIVGKDLAEVDKEVKRMLGKAGLII